MLQFAPFVSRTRNMPKFRFFYFLCFVNIWSFTFGIDNPSPLAEGRLDSLKLIANQAELAAEARIDALLQLSWGLKSNNPLQALEYGKRALQLAEIMGYNLKVANALRHIGVIYWQLGNFSMAMDFLQESNIIYGRISNQLGVARTFSNIGLVFYEQGFYARALENYFRALKILEEKDEKDVLSAVLNNIGLLYQDQGDFKLAEEFHQRSLQIKRQLNDQRAISFSLNSLGTLKQQTGQYQEALEYYTSALAIRQKLLDKREIANTQSNIGHLYILMNQPRLALSNLNQALSLFSEVDDQTGIAQTYYYLALANKQAGRLALAQNFFEKSMQISKKIGHPRIFIENLRGMSGLMAERNEFQRAYAYQIQYELLRDSLFNAENLKKISEMQMLYDRDRSDKEIELLRNTNETIALNLQIQQLLRNFLLGGVLLVLILLFLLYNRFLYISRVNSLLESQKREIEENNLQLTTLNRNLLEQKQKVEELNQKLNQANLRLLESEKHLIETNATKDKFFSIISHDLRNPFASIVSFSRILKRDIQNLDKIELRELAKELDKSVLKINNLLDNLLQWSKTQTGKIKFHPEYLAVSDLIRDNFNLFATNARDKEINMVNSADHELVVYADLNMTNTVIRNLISNALKYSDSGGTIEVRSLVVNKMAKITIKDTGLGMTPEQLDMLWNANTVFTTYGTRDEKGSGLGLVLCREFVEKQGGEITVFSEKGKGTEFAFTLPVEMDETQPLSEN